MDPESKKLLEETFELEKENNKMLHKVRSVQKWSTIWSVLKIILIIGVAFGAFYFIEPYANKIVGVYDSVSGTPQKANSSSFFQGLVNKF
jgi:predicted MFS family arabinose efflux permease